VTLPSSDAVGVHPDVILITVDALRSDALARMPRIRRWASHCIDFDHARSASNFTALGLSALLTGTEPRYLRSDFRIAIVPPHDRADPRSQSQPPTLATILRQAGYVGTVVVPFQPPLLFLFHGFDDVRIPPQRRVTTPASEVLAQARAALGRKPTDRPFLLWAHFLDMHAPYLGGTGVADYRRAASMLDEQLGAFLESLPRDALVVLTADHGEAFGEHGNFTHEETMFKEELRVPLVLCAPESAGLGGGRTDSSLVSTLDVMPTIVELAAAGAVHPLGGRSLVPYLRDGAPEPHAYLRFEGWLPDHHVQAVISGCHKWMRDLDAEWEALFDLCRDPAERHDIAADNPAIVASMRRLLFESADVYPTWLLEARALQQQTGN
jgi:arylsulfatase A-like enzyme